MADPPRSPKTSGTGVVFLDTGVVSVDTVGRNGLKIAR
jgi:hypothetical protein